MTSYANDGNFFFNYTISVVTKSMRAGNIFFG